MSDLYMKHKCLLIAHMANKNLLCDIIILEKRNVLFGITKYLFLKPLGKSTTIWIIT